MLFIRGATIYSPEKIIEKGDILIEQGKISGIGATAQISPPPEATILNAVGMSLVPGFIDLQLNGGFGHDFTTDPETIWEVAAGLPRYGVTSFLPTIITAPLETVARGQEVLLQGNRSGQPGAIPLGLHAEGPFLNHQKKGAHQAKHLRTPNIAEVSAWTLDQGVRLVTLAPELPGATELIETLVAQGVVVSAGHCGGRDDARRRGRGLWASDGRPAGCELPNVQAAGEGARGELPAGRGMD